MILHIKNFQLSSCLRATVHAVTVQVGFGTGYCRRRPPAMATGIQLPTTATTLSLEQPPSIEGKGHAVQKTI